MMNMNTSVIWVRLPLESAYNVRDLGGLPVRDGGQTAWGAFLRADDISALTDGDIRFLLDYGVKTVIDLRCPSEVREKPDRLDEKNGVRNCNISFMDEANVSTDAMKNFENIRMGDLYLDMLRRKDVIKALLVAIADAEPGCILFHCAAGKDRTGVFAMLLLMLAGVDKQDCLNNYGQSYVNLCRNEEFLKGSPDEKYKHMLESRPEYLEPAYAYVEQSGGIAKYLFGCGVSTAVLHAVKERIVYNFTQVQAASF